MRTIKIQPLTAEAFAPYGEVLGGKVAAGVLINAGTSERIALGDPDLMQDGGKPALNLYRAKANPLPFTAQELERHCLGSQSFIPLSGVPFVVIVACGDGSLNARGEAGAAPQENTLAAFLVDGTCGVTFKPRTWHHPLLSQRDGDFIVLERRGESVDCEIKPLSEPVQVILA